MRVLTAHVYSPQIRRNVHPDVPRKFPQLPKEIVHHIVSHWADGGGGAGTLIIQARQFLVRIEVAPICVGQNVDRRTE